MKNEYYASKDRGLVPFLLICPDIELVKIEMKAQVVWFQFSPLKKTQAYVSKFYGLRAAKVDPKVLLDSVRNYYIKVNETKMQNVNGGIYEAH